MSEEDIINDVKKKIAIIKRERKRKISMIIAFISLSLIFAEILAAVGGYLYIRNWDNFIGNYNSRLRVITLNSDLTTVDGLRATCDHEIGHEVWYNRIDKPTKQLFKNLSDWGKRNDYCFYSYDNSTVEDFAESFSMFLNDEHICREKWDFFQKLYAEVRNE